MQRPGALERAALVVRDWHHALDELAQTKQRMIGILDQLQLTSLVASILGLSAVGAAAILAESGDPARFDTARALVKHAGLCPRANQSGAYAGTTRICGRGRAGLRLAAWRAVWGALHANPVLRARQAHLTSRDHNQLTPTKPAPRSLRPCCGGCGWWSPGGCPGRPHHASRATRPRPPTTSLPLTSTP